MRRLNKYDPPRTPEQVATGVRVSYRLPKNERYTKDVKLRDDTSLRDLCKTVSDLAAPWSSVQPTCAAFRAA